MCILALGHPRANWIWSKGGKKGRYHFLIDKFPMNSSIVLCRQVHDQDRVARALPCHVASRAREFRDVGGVEPCGRERAAALTVVLRAASYHVAGSVSVTRWMLRQVVPRPRGRGRGTKAQRSKSRSVLSPSSTNRMPWPSGVNVSPNRSPPLCQRVELRDVDLRAVRGDLDGVAVATVGRDDVAVRCEQEAERRVQPAVLRQRDRPAADGAYRKVASGIAAMRLFGVSAT